VHLQPRLSTTELLSSLVFARESSILKEQRKSLGLSQHELARLAGIPRWRIAYSDSGLLTLTSCELRRVRDALQKRTVAITSQFADDSNARAEPPPISVTVGCAAPRRQWCERNEA
jgi:hypothetical protein